MKQIFLMIILALVLVGCARQNLPTENHTLPTENHTGAANTTELVITAYNVTQNDTQDNSDNTVIIISNQSNATVVISQNSTSNNSGSGQNSMYAAYSDTSDIDAAISELDKVG